MHDGENFYVENDSIKCRHSDFVTKQPVIVIDKQTGVLLKVFDYKDTENIDSYFKKADTIFPGDIQRIDFDSENYSLDNICTIINHFRRSIGSKEMQHVLSMSDSELLSHLHHLQAFGL